MLSLNRYLMTEDLLFQYSIGDALASNEVDPLYDKLVSKGFQYSIGDATSTENNAQLQRYRAFNTPLEMQVTPRLEDLSFFLVAFNTPLEMHQNRG